MTVFSDIKASAKILNIGIREARRRLATAGTPYMDIRNTKRGASRRRKWLTSAVESLSRQKKE